MIAIIDYGVGNLFSLQSSFSAIGQEAVVTSDLAVIRAADRLILKLPAGGIGCLDKYEDALVFFFHNIQERADAGGMVHDEPRRERDDKSEDIGNDSQPLPGACLDFDFFHYLKR